MAIVQASKIYLKEALHRSIGATRFELVLSQPPPEFSLYHLARAKGKAPIEQRHDFIPGLDAALASARKSLDAT